MMAFDHADHLDRGNPVGTLFGHASISTGLIGRNHTFQIWKSVQVKCGCEYAVFET